MLELVGLWTGVANIPRADEQAQRPILQLDLLELQPCRRHLRREREKERERGEPRQREREGERDKEGKSSRSSCIWVREGRGK